MGADSIIGVVKSVVVSIESNVPKSKGVVLQPVEMVDLKGYIDVFKDVKPMVLVVTNKMKI